MRRADRHRDDFRSENAAVAFRSGERLVETLEHSICPLLQNSADWCAEVFISSPVDWAE